MPLIFWEGKLLFRDLGDGYKLAMDLACCCYGADCCFGLNITASGGPTARPPDPPLPDGATLCLLVYVYNTNGSVDGDEDEVWTYWIAYEEQPDKDCAEYQDDLETFAINIASPYSAGNVEQDQCKQDRLDSYFDAFNNVPQCEGGCDRDVLVGDGLRDPIGDCGING